MTKPPATPASVSAQVEELTALITALNAKVDQIQHVLTLVVSDHDILSTLMVSYVRANSPIAARIYDHFANYGQEVVCGVFATLRQQGWIKGEKQGILTIYRVCNANL